MNTQPTPETDAFAIKLKSPCGEKYWVPVDLSRRLERGRDKARKDAIFWQSMAEGRERTADEDQLATVTSQRDRLLEQQKQWKLSSVCRELVDQRDRLAVVLQSIRDCYGGQVADPDCQCEDCEFLIPIDKALQSLTQNSHE